MKTNDEIKKAVEAFFSLHLFADSKKGLFKFWVKDIFFHELVQLTPENIRKYADDIKKALQTRIDEITDGIKSLHASSERLKTFHECMLILKKIKIDKKYSFRERLTPREMMHFQSNFEVVAGSSNSILQYLENVSIKALSMRWETFYVTLEISARIEAEKKYEVVKSDLPAMSNSIFKLRDEQAALKVQRFCEYLVVELRAFRANVNDLVDCFSGKAIGDEVVFDWLFIPVHFIRLLRRFYDEEYAIVIEGKGRSRLDWKFLRKHFKINGQELPKSLEYDSRKTIHHTLERALNLLK